MYVAAALRATVHLIPWDGVFTLRLLTNALGGMYLWGWLVYWVILGGWLALNYYERFVTSELRRERLERRFSEARLNNLRLQLDPHFLFNALNTVSSQVDRDPRLARRMIEHLGDLLRLSLDSKDRQEVTLTEELAFLDHYLAIQRIRFGDHLRIETDVAPEVRHASVPSLILQPLVENAVRHGLASRATGGTVTRHGEAGRRSPGDPRAGRRRRPAPGLAAGHGRRRRPVGDARAHRGAAPERLEPLHGDVALQRRHQRRHLAAAAAGRGVARMTGSLLRVLVVDDEEPARQRLVDLLRRDTGVGGIVEASDGLAAVDAIEREHPDLVFLDVQMPELDGLGVVEAVGATRMPLTVFVTAYDQHAVRAFEANALDYLLKPFSDERHEATMARVRARLGERDLRGFSQRLIDLAAATSPPARYWDRLVVKAGGTTRFVRAAEIDWIEGAGVYATLHLGRTSFLYRAALSELADRLDPRRFVRIHRSAIVNLESVVQLEPLSHGEFEVVLKNGARPRISRTFRAQLEARLGQSL